MSLSQPSPPNPTTTAAAQTQLNIGAAKDQQVVNDVGQVTPYGTLTYNQTGVGADGIPIMTATTQYNPAVQNLLNSTLATQGTIAGAANTLANNILPSLTNPPNLNTSALTNQMMNWGQQYMQPIFNQQQSNLNSQLAAQGITQGSDAYNNAQNLQSRNVNNAYENLFMQSEPTAFSQALASYQAPIQTLGTLLGEGQPQSLTSSLTQTPQANVQPANYESLAMQNYQNQLQQYQATMSGISGVAGDLLGGLARAVPFAASSDRRIKENIQRVGTLNNGLPVYIFNFKKDPDGIPQIGLMAQDVEKMFPEAVVEIDGIKHVYYSLAVRN